MKRNVAQSSLDAYFGGVKQAIAPNQKNVIRAAMCVGVKYTRAELGRICGYSQTSAGRAIGELIKDEIVVEVGRKVCEVNKTNVGAVTLSLAEVTNQNISTNTNTAPIQQGRSDANQGGDK